jgi:hypothetical protein
LCALAFSCLFTSAAFCLLEANYYIKPTLKGREFTRSGYQEAAILEGAYHNAPLAVCAMVTYSAWGFRLPKFNSQSCLLLCEST